MSEVAGEKFSETKIDPLEKEQAAMAAVMGALEGLSPDTVERVCAWAVARSKSQRSATIGGALVDAMLKQSKDRERAARFGL